GVKGLSAGIAYCFPGAKAPSTSIRRILPEQRLQVLSVALRIALAAAVAQADVEEPVGPESELAAIVVVKRLVDHEQDVFAGSVGLVRIRTGGRVFGEQGLELQAQRQRVIDKEAAIRA